MQNIYPYVGSTIKTTFSFENFPTPVAIRFDPIDTNCILKLNSAIFTTRAQGKVNAKFTSNGMIWEELYVFGDDDPNLYMENIPDDVLSLTVEYKVIAFDDDMIAFYKDKATHLVQEFAKLEDNFRQLKKDRDLVDADRQKLSTENEQLHCELTSGRILLRRLIGVIKRHLGISDTV